MIAPTPRPLVTIVTATRNSDKTLARAIQSVREQTYEPIEHIIVDGLSTDGTEGILRRFEDLQDRRMRVIREPDGGMYEAINKGLRRTGGEFVGILNSDDWYAPDAVEKVVGRFAATQADVVLGNIRCVTREGAGGETSREWVARVECLDTHMSVPHPAVFVRSEIYRRLGLFDERYKIAADYEFLLRLRASGVAMSHLDAVLCNFQLGGMSHARLWPVAFETYRVQQRHIGTGRAAMTLCRRAIEYSFLRWLFQVVGWLKRKFRSGSL